MDAPRCTRKYRFLRYFSGKVVGDVAARAGKQSLFCLVPHGVFPFGIALSSLSRWGVVLVSYYLTTSAPGGGGIECLLSVRPHNVQS